MRRETLIQAGWQAPLWLTFMIAVSLTFSVGFACATPLAALGAAAALTLDRKTAVLFTGVVWLANQACGYALLHYPVTANSLEWGAALGLAAIAATLGARFAAERLAGHSRLLAIGAAFLAAFVTYEALQYLAALLALGGTEDYTLAIVAREVELNAIAMAALLALNHAGTVVRGRPAAGSLQAGIRR